MAIKTFVTGSSTLTVADNDVTVIGGTGGTEKVKIQSGVTGTSVDANVEKIDLAGNLAEYKFVFVAGTGTQIQTAAGAVVGTIPSLNQDAVVAFADGAATLKQTGASTFTLGGQTVGTTAAAITSASMGTSFDTATKSSVAAPAVVAPKFSLSATSTSVAEGNATNNTLALTVTRSGTTTGTDSVVIQTANGTGANAATATDFTALSQTVTFAPGETTKTVNFTTTADTVRENDETLSVSLGTPSAGTSLDDTAKTLTLTITNDDANLLPVLTVPSTTPSAFIGSSTTVSGVSFTDADDNTGFTINVQAAGSSQVSFGNLSTATAKNAAGTALIANETANTIVLSGTKSVLNDVLATLKYTSNSTVATTEQVTVTVTDVMGGSATQTFAVNVGLSRTLTSSSDSLVGSAGDDEFSGTLANFGVADTIQGSTGTDKLILTSVDGALPALTTAATGLEILDLTTDLASTDRTVSFDAAKLGSTLTTVNFTTNNDTVAGSADSGDALTATTANAGTTFNMQNTSGALTISAVNGTAGTTDAFTVALAGGVTVSGLGIVDGGTNVIDILNIRSNGSSANTVAAIDVDTGTIINVSGSQALTVTAALPNLGSTGKFDASNATGKITVTAAAASATTIIGGSAGDSIVGSTGASDSLVGGAGNDTITGGTSADTIVGGLGADSITGGATGVNTYVFAAGDSGNTSTTRDTLVDLREGDIIKFGTALTGLTNGATVGSTGTVRIDATNKLLIVGNDEINIPTAVANAAFTYSYGADAVAGTADDTLTVGAAPLTATNNALGTLTLTGKAIATVAVNMAANSGGAPTVGGATVGNNAVRTVDASLVTNAGVSVTGSTGADTITGTAQTDTFVIAAATDSTVVTGAATTIGAAGIDTISVSTGDTFTLTGVTIATMNASGAATAISVGSAGSATAASALVTAIASGITEAANNAYLINVTDAGTNNTFSGIYLVETTDTTFSGNDYLIKLTGTNVSSDDTVAISSGSLVYTVV